MPAIILHEMMRDKTGFIITINKSSVNEGIVAVDALILGAQVNKLGRRHCRGNIISKSLKAFALILLLLGVEICQTGGGQICFRAIIGMIFTGIIKCLHYLRGRSIGAAALTGGNDD